MVILGMLLQVWLVGAVVTIFIIFILEALHREPETPTDPHLRTPLQHPDGTLWKPK